MAAAVVGLRAVGGACGAVELGLGGWECAVGGGGGSSSGAIGGRFRRGINPVCHFVQRRGEEKGMNRCLFVMRCT